MAGLDPAIFYVSGVSEALGAGETVWGQLWNGQTNHPLRVHYISARSTSNVTAVGARIERSSARGTVTGSVTTPDVDNHLERLSAVPANITLDLGFTAQPTLLTPDLMRPGAGLIDRTGSGFDLYLYGSDDEGIDIWTPITVPAGTGLCVSADVSSSVALRISFGFSIG